MSSIDDGQFETKTMNAVVDIETANRFSTRLENIEAQRLGVCVSKARERIARRIGVSPGTLENMRRLRTKVVPNWIMSRIRAELIAVLHTEIKRLEHEITVCRQAGMDYREDDLAKAQAHLAETKRLLNL